MVYTRDNRIFEPLIDWNTCCPDDEWVWSIMKLPQTRDTYVCTLYRPPSGSVDTFLQLLEEKLVHIYEHGIVDIVILGDMNINTKQPRHYDTKKYANSIKLLNLSQLITDPTHITISSSSIIDHVLVNRADMYYQHGVLSLGISGHCLVYCTEKKAKIQKSHTYIKCRSYNNFIDADFQKDILIFRWF